MYPLAPQEENALGQPLLREWELNENSTRFEYLSAAPSQSSMVLMWSILAAITGIITVLVTSVFLSILLSAKARKNPFNIYLATLLVADIVGNANCHVTCLWSALQGSYASEWMCYYQSFYSTWIFTTSSWLNAVVSWQLYQMLHKGSHFRRYRPPTRTKVVWQASLVYAYAAFLSSWVVIPIDFWPIQTAVATGLGCIPLEGPTTLTRTIFYVVFLPLQSFLPMTVLGWVVYKIWKEKLLPPLGSRRRELALYFFRIMFIFVVLWTPYLLLVFVAAGGPWPLFAGGVLGHLQGAVTVGLCLTKADIHKAFVHFWTCRICRRGKATNTNTRGDGSSLLFSFLDRPQSRQLSFFGLQWSNLSSDALHNPDEHTPWDNKSICDLEEGANISRQSQEQSGSDFQPEKETIRSNSMP